ncbi:hypothetical protein [Segetibacter aerophilus]|uniref:Uncharacterized protein n=1 Tax=Segetibacter aerophilus TaxID=670293 RepID=A0A512BB11_9BACT|nr:hypothetical protein [Segetibacter aerophilus]GEO09166.1 hypothetical protein SAE01_16620 [Segetibacter aerophilus]
MSEEKIQLPDFLIAELYKGSLVDLQTFNSDTDYSKTEEKSLEVREPIATTQKISFLGENKKGVIVIVYQLDAVFLKEEDLAFLTNILKACQLNLADIAIINLSKQEIDYNTLQEQLTSKTILLFDVEPSALKLPFMIPAFQAQKFSGSTIMVAPSLSLINKAGSEGKLLKTKLWTSLKVVFDL